MGVCVVKGGGSTTSLNDGPVFRTTPETLLYAGNACSGSSIRDHKLEDFPDEGRFASCYVGAALGSIVFWASRFQLLLSFQVVRVFRVLGGCMFILCVFFFMLFPGVSTASGLLGFKQPHLCVPRFYENFNKKAEPQQGQRGPK